MNTGFLHFCAVTVVAFVTAGEVDLDQWEQWLSRRHGGLETPSNSTGNPIKIPANGQMIG